ncbi:MAG TPA: methionine--tRNA ligase [Candidatus Azoamicus sp. MARI]
MSKKIFITSALPYANGDLHIGHMLEFIQTDIWLKYNKIIGNQCVYISGIDSHGTPIMLKSLSEKVSFEKLINRYFLLHKIELDKFSISIDNYYTTHSYENELLSKKIYRRLYEKNLIFKKYINQFYDIKFNMFLPDRYVIGTCPSCKAKDQYGDICEKCNNKYDAIELLNPISILSKDIPIKKSSLHYFFDLQKFAYFLKTSLLVNISQKSISNKLMEWLDLGLKAWDISRDYPYFGFNIPSNYKKFFYVWLDAPIGYLSFFLNFLLNNKLIYFNTFSSIKKFDMYHFIGKDIIYFHALFWPALLYSSNFNLFKDVFVHGFLTVNNLKMSKSGNTFVNAKDVVSNVDADCLRFYFASKLNPYVIDIDFNFVDFINKINSDLVGKFLNIISRCSKIIKINYNSFLSSNLHNLNLFEEYIELKKFIFKFYETRDYSKVVFYVMKYTDKINVYLDNEKPWILIKSNKTFEHAHNVCTTAINLFLILLFILKPIIPDVVKNIEIMLNLNLCDFNTPFLGIKIGEYNHIINRY